MKDFLRRPSAVAAAASPSSSSVDRVPHTEPPLTSPRMSILPSVRIPLLRRQESEAPPSHKKSPLLSLCLSSNSFLDCCAKASDSGQVLYEIKTSGTSTSILRSNAKHVFVRAASVKWPRVLPSQAKDADFVLVQMKGGRWTGGDSLLKPAAAPNGPRKFNIPEYSQSMKWKRYGTVYWCTTTAVKGPIAILEMAKGTEPTKLTMYETLHDKYDPDGLSHFQGVSVLLLDYVLTTALLLVTDIQEWMVVQKYEDSDAVPSLPLPSHAAGSSAADKSLTSDPQLRKIMYGEPIYPKLSRQDLRSKHSSSSTTPSMFGGPLTPTSSTSAIGATYVSTYGDSLGEGPSGSNTSSALMLSPKQPLGSIMSTSDDYDDDFSIANSTRPPSPAVESVYFSSSSHSGPGHQQFDPSFYGSPKPPPVPPLPAHLHLSHAHSFSYSRSTTRNSRMLAAASLPATPTSAVSRGFHHAHSSPVSSHFPSNASTSATLDISPVSSAAAPDLANAHGNTNTHSYTSTQGSPERAASIRSVTSTMSRRSVTAGVRRPLPRPPPVPTPAANTNTSASTSSPKPASIPRRAQSSVQLRSEYGAAERGREVIPPVPTRPQRSLPRPPQLTTNTSSSSSPSPSTLTTTTATTSILKSMSAVSLIDSPAHNQAHTQTHKQRPSIASITEESSHSSTSHSHHPHPHSHPHSHHPTHTHTHNVPLPTTTGAPLDMYGRRPPITKASQEDLTHWVHSLTSPQRDLPPDPLPSTSIFDVPPPAYDTIVFGNGNGNGNRDRGTGGSGGGRSGGESLRRQGTRRRAATQSNT